MTLLYADENFDFPVVVFLRQRGHDIVTVQAVGRAGAPDPDVLADATTAGRAVLTYNRKHFYRLHRQGAAHAGIISCTHDPDHAALADRIHQFILSTGTLSGQYLRVYRPP